ncbi:helix-turn-helix domain-containing protein [Staphylococcus capitis]|uniref:helix-turn-helix domain-containing protein n=1 Tax=Staphylococcus capitis TaxID=29388 RepID=UPI00145B6A1E|nr:helix-turn-helix domain-containing protein [Staphylococcus capitis]MEB5628455.1 helix-turn-helix domain-containing protein [Staphylococcus capitis]NMK90596.1 helix-turn-helix domain-containing protein [Staphylococcus capitis]NMK92065.1 helix-turn-helix domain-containing protein [Staphylococcus capitis]
MPRTRASINDWLTKENLLRIQGWARDGLTNDQIAKNMGITERTLYKWQRRDNQIRQVLNVGKDVADREVENALFKSAIGYDYEEETVTNQGDVVTVKKHKSPNTTAQIFWLKNRKHREWRDKRDVAHEGEINSSINFSNISDDDLRELAKYQKD